MSTFFFLILVVVGLLLWQGYRILHPVISAFRGAFGASRDGRRKEAESAKPKDEEQSSVDLIHETNMDLEGGRYVDFEELKEPSE